VLLFEFNGAVLPAVAAVPDFSSSNIESRMRPVSSIPSCILLTSNILKSYGLECDGRIEHMGILQTAKPVAIICTSDRPRATKFYRDALGLTLTSEDPYAAIFDVAGIPLRVSTVPDFKPHEHNILGFKVSDVTATVRALRNNGVSFNIYEGFNQDDLGIMTPPGTTLQVAWFNDPDGNVLSITNA
jgi:catechol 2,3-dioxygenase-like lactoylglutathione lyase family enzyme